MNSNANARSKQPQPPAPSDQLRAVILARGLTPYGAAVAAGVAPSIMSRFMSGRRGLALETFDRVTTALGLRLVEVSRGRGRPRKRPAAVGAGEYASAAFDAS